MKMDKRIKCYLIEKTGKLNQRACSCGDPKCTDTSQRAIWRRTDTGAEGDLYNHEIFPPGAMWFAPWYTDVYAGFDGRCLVVRTPGGDWIIDSEASNCTRKGDKTHRCWVREGEPPNVTVGKGGETCAAGAGSILQEKRGGHSRDYHGFLRNGYLEEC